MLGRALKYVVIALMPFIAATVAMAQKGMLDSYVALFLFYATATGILLVVLMLLERWLEVTQYIDTVFSQAKLPLPNTTDLTSLDKLHAVLDSRKQGEEYAQRNMMALENLFEHLPDALLLLDGSSKIISANITARKILGQQVEGKGIAAVLRHSQALKAIDAAVADGLQHTLEMTLNVPQERHYQVIIEGVAEKINNSMQLLIILQDQSAVKQAQRAHADFIAYASHELRTPLTALLGFIETLQGAAKDDPTARAQFLGIMQEQATRMSRLINDLLSLSRLEQKHNTLLENCILLGPVLQSTVDALQIKAAQKEMAISCSIPPASFAVLGDADELMQLFQNLVDNAIKYGTEKTAIEIAIEKIDDKALLPDWPDALQLQAAEFVRVSITNQGEGIATDETPRLTERFFRASNARAASDTGTGLGLSIVKHIVARHNGLLHIESVLGRSTTVCVYLPLIK